MSSEQKEGANRGRFYGCSETTVNRTACFTGDQKTRRFFAEQQEKISFNNNKDLLIS